MEERRKDERYCDLKHNDLKCLVKQCIKTLEARLDGMDKALKLETVERERRLEGLNQLREEYTKDRISDRTQYVRQETYEIKMGSHDVVLGDLSQRLTIIETRIVVWSAALVFFFLLAQFGLHYFGIIK
jgi:hypothetical protein